MKTFLKSIIPLMLLFAMTFNATAANPTVSVVVDGKTLDTEAVIIDGRTLVPVRALSEALNATVDWDEATQRVTLTKILYKVDRTTGAEYMETVTVRLWINSTEATVNGYTVPLDVAPQIIDGRTMLPARAVCGWLEASVEWDDATKIVSVTKGPYESFSDARYYNATIEVAERNAIDNMISEGQDELDKYFAELSRWITDDELNREGVYFEIGIGFWRFDKANQYTVHAVPDYTEDSLEIGETGVFNGITIKKTSRLGHEYLIEELKELGILS